DRCQVTAGATSFCGDGKVDTEREQCDDGNAADFDGCNTSCNFAPETFGEVGTAMLSSSITTISLSRNYQNPVVFLSPLSYNETDVAVPRITWVGGDSFDVYIQEAEYLDGNHTNETLFYMVLEKGLWQLENDAIVQVDTVNTDRISQNTAKKGTAKQITLDSTFTQRPSILTQVQTLNDSQFVATRHKHLSDTVFEISMNHQESNKNPHAQETIGWVAMQNGQDTWSFINYEVATQPLFKHQWKSLNLTDAFTANALVFASLSSINGGDPSFLRYQLNLPNVHMRIQEDQSRDNETSHTNEDISFIGFSHAGPLWGWSLNE
ncbi:MAG: DUF4215 domain-containing protein, partial [Myxococcota bacterium]